MLNDKTWKKEYFEYVNNKIQVSEESMETQFNEIMFDNHTNVIFLAGRAPNDYLINVFKKWKIIIDLSEINIIPKIYYGMNCLTDKYYETYYDVNEKYNKKFKKYIEFLNTVMEYIKKEINNMKIKTVIKLVIIPVKDNARIYPDEDFYNFQNIKCLCSFEVEGVKHKFVDYNILVNGLSCKSSGFIFMINELCCDDYLREDTE